MLDISRMLKCFGFLKNLSVWIWDLRFCMKVIVFALKQDWNVISTPAMGSPRFDADDLGLGEQLANVTHGQAVEQVHQDDDGDEDKEDEEGEVEEGERVAAVYGQVGELQLADEHGESLEDAGPQSVKVFHPVFIFKVGVLEKKQRSQ